VSWSRTSLAKELSSDIVGFIQTEQFMRGWNCDVGSAQSYDLQRSVAPGKPRFNSENHPIRDMDPVWGSSGRMTTILWQGVVQGQDAIVAWVVRLASAQPPFRCVLSAAMSI